MLQVHDIYKAYSGTIMSPFASCLTHPEKSVQQGLYLVWTLQAYVISTFNKFCFCSISMLDYDQAPIFLLFVKS